MTGIHAFHVISGLIARPPSTEWSRMGASGRGTTWGGEGSVKYLHFVEVAWVFIYPVLYLVN